MEETEGKSTDYGKVAVAVAKIQNSGTKIELPIINEAEKGFIPKHKENRIIYSLKAINGIGDEVVDLILKNRPFSSLEDFYKRMIDTKLIKTAQMIKLIKAGCFSELCNEKMSRKDVMKNFIETYLYEEKTSLTLANLKKIEDYNLIPEELKILLRIRKFKEYVLEDRFKYQEVITPDKKVPKCGYHDRLFKTDDLSTPFLLEYFTEECIIKAYGDNFIFSEKKFIKEFNEKMKLFNEWLSLDDTIKQFNEKTFEEVWNKYASGSKADWYMDSIGMYYKEHALEHIDTMNYNIENFNNLPEEPNPYEWYTRTIKGEPKNFPKYRISRLCGTIISNDPKHYSITLLTHNKEVVNVKMTKGHFAYYNKRISEKLDSDSNKKTVLENSWLSRGNKIFVHGMRKGDKFYCKTYKDSIFSHSVYLINSINDDGLVKVTTERVQI